MTPVLGTLVNGVYTAPAALASSQTVTIKATAAADGITSALATVTLIPLQVSVTPAAVSLTQGQSQQFAATVTGNPNTAVIWSMVPQVGTLANGTYTAPAPIPARQTVVITATSAVDGTTSGSAALTLIPLEVTVTPGAVIVSQGQTQQFTANVAGSTNTAVTWSITPLAGTVVNGLYTAPATVSTKQIVIVKATSVVDGTTSGQAAISLNPLQVSISPGTINLLQGQNQQFAAVVTGSANTAVIWSMTPQLGTLVNGLYTSPSLIATQQTVAVKATSVVDGSTAASATITLLPPPLAFTPIRVNAGGPAYTDSHGYLWAADTGYDGGSAFTTSQTVGNTSRPAIYQSERSSSETLQYQFNGIPAGSYTVNMRFAELVYSTPGQRVFNIAINGVTLQSNFDIVAAAGAANWAADLGFPVTVSGGQITIQFISIQQSAEVNAIEILQNSAAAVTVAVSPLAATLSQGQSTQLTSIVSGTTNPAVTWSMTPQVGTLMNGLYTAPAPIAAAQTVTVRATSVADGVTSGAAALTLAPLKVSVSPAGVSLMQGQSKQFTATVTGAADTTVTWSMTPLVGTLIAGLYTAPLG